MKVQNIFIKVFPKHYLYYSIALIFVVNLKVNAQTQSQRGQKTATAETHFFDRKLETAMANNARKKYKSRFVGSPYYEDDFVMATISPLNERFLVRYNAELDEMEAIQGRDTLIINKAITSYTIQLDNDKTYKILYSKFGKKSRRLGYFMMLDDDQKITLYKRNYKKTRSRKDNSYGHANTNGYIVEFREMKPEFYIEKEKNGIALKLSKKKKHIVTIFPKRAEKIIAFIEKEKIKLHNEENVKKLVTYIRSLY